MKKTKRTQLATGMTTLLAILNQQPRRSQRRARNPADALFFDIYEACSRVLSLPPQTPALDGSALSQGASSLYQSVIKATLPSTLASLDLANPAAPCNLPDQFWDACFGLCNAVSPSDK